MTRPLLRIYQCKKQKYCCQTVFSKVNLKFTVKAKELTDGCDQQKKGQFLPNPENNQRVFGIVIQYGFETKNFFESALYDEIAQRYRVVVLRRNFPTSHFAEFVDRYGLTVLTFGGLQAMRVRLRVENLFLGSRRSRQRLKQVENFNYFRSDRATKWLDYLLGNSVVYFFLRELVTRSLDRHYVDAELSSLFDDQKLTDILMPGYASEDSICLARTALHGGKKVWLVVNSWKDFYVNDYIPFTPTATFVWSEAMKKQVAKLNPHLLVDELIVSGNPAFDRFVRYSPQRSIEYYASKYDFDVHRPVILYSMMSPKAYAKEIGIIELINQRLNEVFVDEFVRPVIILRRNPIDATPADINRFSGNNVRYADSFFEDQIDPPVFVQTHEGETEWKDLISHAVLNINVASTVTLEALLLDTPVINIEFDESGQRDATLRRYAEAPFYTPLRGREDVVIAQDIEQCMTAIKAFMTNKSAIEDLSEILTISDAGAVKTIIDTIQAKEL